MGFSMVKGTGSRVKLVRGHCEVHIRQEGESWIFEIPVVRLSQHKESPMALCRYLLERNGESKGPGFFGIREEMVWYRAALPADIAQNEPGLEKTVLSMQEAVERLGPKVLNLMGQ